MIAARAALLAAGWPLFAALVTGIVIAAVIVAIPVAAGIALCGRIANPVRS